MISRVSFNESPESVELMIIKDLPLRSFRLIRKIMSGMIRMI
jgi:hypothetical protein